MATMSCSLSRLCFYIFRNFVFDLWIIQSIQILEKVVLLRSIKPQIIREGFLRKNIVAVSFFQNWAMHPYS